METEFRARLKADPTIAGLAQTVDWNIRPQGKPLPAITMNRVNGSHDQTMNGLEATQDPLIQIDCWGLTYSDVVTLRNAVVSILATPATQDGVRFLAAQNITDHDLPQETELGPVYRSMIRANVWHTTP